MKKKITVCLFLALILVTAIHCIVTAVETYRFEMDPNSGVDIFEGFGAFVVLLVGGFVILYELDLFFTVYYFVSDKKAGSKTILNIASNLCLLLTLAYVPLSDHCAILRAWEFVPFVLFAAYFVLRLVYCGIVLYLMEKRNG